MLYIPFTFDTDLYSVFGLVSSSGKKQSSWPIISKFTGAVVIGGEGWCQLGEDTVYSTLLGGWRHPWRCLWRGLWKSPFIDGLYAKRQWWVLKLLRLCVSAQLPSLFNTKVINIYILLDP